MTPTLVDQIDELLPQTQCTQCGYKGCRPYAEAIANGTADINQCPPGGSNGIQQLADLLNIETKPLNPKHGQEQPRRVAVIIEQDCIGCTKCLPPCPVDAIVGANKLLHTVIERECTGCELCIDPCPVNCIVMQEPSNPFIWDKTSANHARDRFRAKAGRIEKQEQAKAERLLKQKQMIARLKAQKNI